MERAEKYSFVHASGLIWLLRAFPLCVVYNKRSKLGVRSKSKKFDQSQLNLRRIIDCDQSISYAYFLH